MADSAQLRRWEHRASVLGPEPRVFRDTRRPQGALE